MRNIIVCTGIIAALTASANAQQAQVGSHTIIPAPPHQHREQSGPPMFPDNSSLNPSSLKSQSAIAQLASQQAARSGATVASTVFGKWQAIAKQNRLEDIDANISPNRSVYAVILVHATPLETDFGQYAPGAKIVTIYDAQTGRVLEGGLRGTLVKRYIRGKR